MLTLIFGILVGLALGLTGGGGSIFAVPLLIFGLGIAPQEAITISLAAVTLVAFIGTISAAKTGLVEYRAGAIFAAAGLVTAPFGVLIANNLEDRMILTAFSILVILVSASMWRRAGSSPQNTTVVRANFSSVDTTAGAICRFNPDNKSLRLTAPCSLVLTLAGTVTGILSGLFGVGGGFIIVPALMIITRLSIQRAVATSLFVITLIGTSGIAAAIISARKLDLAVTALFLAGGITGMLMGRKIANRIAGPLLQKTFAGMLLLVAAVTLLSH
ncbi:MAG: sulfite exporter TauE/SafE family protein [Porticoccaceae bacterium]|nr:sulfite exporter TauE/SafE family protein [Porticoccaceae bacterium]